MGEITNFFGGDIVSEYHYILSLYRNYRQYSKKIILFAGIMILLSTIFVALNLVRVSPFLVYMIAMAVTLMYALRKRSESKYYGELKKFIGTYNPDLIHNEELLFFIDYQLKSYFENESVELFIQLTDDAQWNDEPASDHLKKIISEIESYYTYLTANSDLEQNIEISLDVYRKSIVNRKNDLV